jgi:hypothetical protein
MTKVSDITIKGMSPQLLVADIKHSLDFYTKLLGFEIEFCYENFYAGIRKDGFSIHLKTGKYSIEERQNRKKMMTLTLCFRLTILKTCTTNYQTSR